MKKKIVNIATYKAMKKLLNCYEKREGLKECPLCEVSTDLSSHTNCKRCPWGKFEGKTCIQWVNVTYTYLSIVICRSRPYRSECNEMRLKRIEMLKDWMSRSIVIPFWPF